MSDNVQPSDVMVEIKKELTCSNCSGLGRWNHNPFEPNGWPCEDCNGTGWNPEVYVPDILSYLEIVIAAETNKAVQEAEKAYGGCHLCYGKGYATVNEYVMGGGMKWKADNIKPCSCDRGKQFAEVKAELKTTTPERGSK